MLVEEVRGSGRRRAADTRRAPEFLELSRRGRAASTTARRRPPAWNPRQRRRNVTPGSLTSIRCRRNGGRGAGYLVMVGWPGTLTSYVAAFCFEQHGEHPGLVGGLVGAPPPDGAAVAQPQRDRVHGAHLDVVDLARRSSSAATRRRGRPRRARRRGPSRRSGSPGRPWGGSGTAGTSRPRSSRPRSTLPPLDHRDRLALGDVDAHRVRPGPGDVDALDRGQPLDARARSPRGPRWPAATRAARAARDGPPRVEHPVPGDLHAGDGQHGGEEHQPDEPPTSDEQHERRPPRGATPASGGPTGGARTARGRSGRCARRPRPGRPVDGGVVAGEQAHRRLTLREELEHLGADQRHVAGAERQHQVAGPGPLDQRRRASRTRTARSARARRPAGRGRRPARR